MTFLTIATAIQFVLLLGLAIVVLSLARQVGILHERLSPAGMSRAREAIQVGQAVPELALDSISGARVSFAGGPSALLFVSSECPICRSVLPAFEAVLPESDYQGFWVADGLPGPSGEVPDYGRYAEEHHVDEDRLLISQELGLTLGVRQLPALVLLDAEQRLVARETLSGPRQVAALMDSRSA
jgi:methylamine dehydrogenase accessory protein MauD